MRRSPSTPTKPTTPASATSPPTKAVSLAPAAERTRVKAELAEVKANPSGEKTYTTTTNGKTYVGKLNSKGELKATEQVTTPSTKSSGTTKK